MFSHLLSRISRPAAFLRHASRNFHVSATGNASSSERPQFPGSRSQWTEKLQFLHKNDVVEGIPVYRVMSRDGKVIDSSQDPGLGEETTTRIYKGRTVTALVVRSKE